MTTTTLASLTDVTPLAPALRLFLPALRLPLLCMGVISLHIITMKMGVRTTRSLPATSLTSVLLPSSPVLLCRLSPVCAKGRVCMKL